MPSITRTSGPYAPNRFYQLFSTRAGGSEPQLNGTNSKVDGAMKRTRRVAKLIGYGPKQRCNNLVYMRQGSANQVRTNVHCLVHTVGYVNRSKYWYR